ncbi:MAG: hypothetical protein KDB00_19410, partial [Planctomycetales bacterium]|nr:hypothetical protein [Planctomycetales bacterium]
TAELSLFPTGEFQVVAPFWNWFPKAYHRTQTQYIYGADLSFPNVLLSSLYLFDRLVPPNQEQHRTNLKPAGFAASGLRYLVVNVDRNHNHICCKLACYKHRKGNRY